MEHHFSLFISTYRKSFSTENGLIKLLEDCGNKLNNNNVVSAFLKDLSKSFGCIASQLTGYFSKDTVAYIYSYLKIRNQCVRINGTQGYLRDIISDVIQRSILGPILYNLFKRLLSFHFINKCP